eukprot:EG_transcript_14828
MAAASRLVTASDEEVDLENDIPLVGVNKAPDLPLAEAVRHGMEVHGMDEGEIQNCLKCAQKKAAKLLKDHESERLTRDEIGAVYMYTLESPLYKNLNGLLRQRKRDKLKPLFPYLKLLLTALHKLPLHKITAFRGVKEDLSGKYIKNDEIVWWGFTSTTCTADVLADPQFLGPTGPRTMFSIATSRAVDIRRYSAYGESEDERLLMPGVQLTVKAKLPSSDGLCFIQLEECSDHPSLLSFEAPSLIPEQSPIASLLAKAEDCFDTGWSRMEEHLKRATLDWGALVAHCQQNRDTDARCQFVLGMCYMHGEGVVEDEAEAVRLFRLAAGRSHLRAQLALGECYVDGRGVVQDSEAAAQWYRKAAEADAQQRLGACYANGEGVAKDSKEAVQWFRKSAEA